MMKFDAAHGLLKEEIGAYQEEVSRIHRMIHEKTGAGNDFLGWVDWAETYDRDEVARIKALAEQWQGKFDVLVVCGIGGSYLGARAAIEMIRGLYPADGPEVIFAGNTFSSTYMAQVLRHLEGKSVLLNVISKSGTTTETALAFRMLRQFMENTYGTEEAGRRIFATTDRARGTLKALADEVGYATFVIPDDIGGRYSVITSVGLLPMALMGIDPDEVLRGYKDASRELNTDDLAANDAYRYAVSRRILEKQGYDAEMFVSYEPQLSMLAEWWKQLMGESEGKDGKGILPDSAVFSTDLHSLGQFVQEGKHILFETVVRFLKPRTDVTIEEDPENGDGFNFVAGKPLDFVNEKAFLGTLLAHTDGGVPNMVLTLETMDAYNLGELIFFLEKACAVSGYILGINPFNQPGVESYKKNMFALIGKPGYEAHRAELETRLGN